MNEPSEIYNSLKGSALFNLSLSSKELFHSNFIAWLWEQNPEGMCAVFKSKLKNKPTVLSFSKDNIEICREALNIDISIEFISEKYKIIVENKVKSLPDKEQLNEYTNKFKNSDEKIDFILLSLTKPVFFEEGADCLVFDKWLWMNYDELAIGLKELKLHNDYHVNLRDDYVNFIENLSKLIQSCQVKSDSDFFGKISPLISNEELKNLRIMDLVQKLRYAELAELVKGKVEYLLKITCEPLGNWGEGSKEIGQIFIGSGMTRSMGLFDIKFVVANKRLDDKSAAVLGIQLQGNSFRLNFELISINNRAEEIAKHLRSESAWFKFDLAEELKACDEHPNRSDRDFNKFGSSFFYRSKTINNISANRLVDIIVLYIKHIISDLTNISTIVNDV